jgi:CubicO group peptidase (beta-lactamase class C family)
VLAEALFLAAAAASADRHAAETAAELRALVGSGEPGLAVLVRRDGRTAFEQGYGVRDLRTRAPIDGRTSFRLASVTKQLTAAAIVKLVSEGHLRYDEPLTEALPGFPAYGRNVTIRHLLTHTGGLPDYEQLMDEAEAHGAPAWSPERQIRDDEVLGLLGKAEEGRFAPGSRWAYSNSGYVVLGLIAARADGRPFGEVLSRRIFAPLGMARTLAYVRGQNEVPDRAFGHTKQASGFRETDQSSTSATLGDGGVYSCLEDLAKWDEALRTSAFFTEAEAKLVLTPVRLADGAEPSWPREPGDDNLFPGRPVAYGFGWFLDPWQGRPRAWHHGETMGFRSIVDRLTGDGLSVVILSNRDDLDLRALALKLVALQLGR